MKPPQTVGDFISLGAKKMQASEVVFGQGTTNAQDESRWLVLSALDLPIDSDDSVLDQPVEPQKTKRINDFFDRRILNREPTAYITGIAWLKGYGFHVSPQTIIPRSYIAELLLDGLYPHVQDPGSIHSVLDLCTGSGCLAIIASDAFPMAKITASDLSEEALTVARKNLESYGLLGRISLTKSDLFDGLPVGERFDLIISNPPYVPKSRKAEMAKEFQCEPEMALFAADDGMALVEKILRQAAQWLNPEGLLVVEVGLQTKACESMLSKKFHDMPVLWVQTPEQSDHVFIVDQPTLSHHTRRI